MANDKSKPRGVSKHMPTCFVIQPFDGGKFDGRYKDTFKPAVEAAGFAAYRVDEDTSVSVPIQHIEQRIREATVCLADITLDNANVFFELGYALACSKPVVILCERSARIHFPFDIRHRHIIHYDTGTVSDYTALQNNITARLKAIDTTSTEVSGLATIEQFKYFPPPGAENFNEPFYEYFVKKIDAARNQIYVSGEGFEGARLRGRELAKSYHDATKRALQKGVRVVRVQTRGNISPQWAAYLKELLTKFPAHFELYYLKDSKDKTVTDLMSLCVIDPESSHSCTVQMMFSTRLVFGTKTTNIAGTAMFIEGNQPAARDFQQRFLEMKRTSILAHIDTAGAVYELLTADQLYFSYGTNMSKKRMQDRVRHAKMVQTGYIHDYKLEFNKKSAHRLGGIPSIVPHNGDKVYGVIWQIPILEIETLDKLEDLIAYERIKMPVMGSDDTLYSCYVYQAKPEGIMDPDPECLAIMISAARDSRLPEQYIARLEALRPKQGTI
jgi:gamma-glutamylcyclotransferase (GGCT)/AIG2-like uncharacterized protein YtfP